MSQYRGGGGGTMTTTPPQPFLTDMINRLDAEAFEKAQRVVQKRFNETVHLDDVEELRAEYKKKLSSIELQLSGMVQVKLDGVNRAMDVIKAANEQMVSLRSEFENMHELCRKAGESGKLVFDAYPNLKKVNRARRNLERTLKEVNYYANLPSRVEVLVNSLETAPLQIKQVYLEGQQLEIWRDELLRELKTIQAFRSPPRKGPGGASSVSDRMQAAFGVHLEEVKKLLDAIRKKIFDNISNCFEIVQIDPRILIVTLEIIDMHEEFQTSKAKAAKQRAEKDGNDVDEALALSLIEDLRADVITRLTRNADERAKQVFTEAQASAGADPDNVSPFSAKLNAATKILLDLNYLKAEVVRCFPPERYNVMDVFRNKYEHHLVEQIGALYQRGMHELDQGELLQLMEWLDYYNQQIVQLGASKPCSEFETALSVCLQEYLVRVRTQMTEWFTNILNREQEVNYNAQGQPMTSTPEDFFNLIHLQVRVATRNLGADNICAVVVVCLNVIRAILEETLKRLRTQGSAGEISLDILCSLVNDYDRLQEKIEEFRDGLKDEGKLREDHLIVVEGAIDQVQDGFLSIALEANTILAQTTLKDVREAMTEELFTMEWEDSNEVIMTKVTMTFQDYYNDLSVWLPAFYFSKLVRECMEKVVALYLYTIFRRGRKEDKRKAFKDSLRVAQKVRNDRQAVSDFFTEYETQLVQAGLRTSQIIEQQYRMLDAIVELFETGAFNSESESTTDLLRELGSWGVEAVVSIAMLRGEKDKMRAELKDTLTRFYDKVIRPGLHGGGGAATAAPGSPGLPIGHRYPLSPFDPEVDHEAFLTGVKKPKGKK